MKDINDFISSVRKDYGSHELLENNISASPFRQFEKWMEDAVKLNVMDAIIMTLATATKEGKPTARIVLLRGFGEDGFEFFTNYNSRKGNELISNPFAAINFFW